VAFIQQQQLENHRLGLDRARLQQENMELRTGTFIRRLKQVESALHNGIKNIVLCARPEVDGCCEVEYHMHTFHRIIKRVFGYNIWVDKDFDGLG
jgi:hypothetical protein